MLEPIECAACNGNRVRAGTCGVVICRPCKGEGRVAPPAFAHPAPPDSLDDLAELDRELAELDARAVSA